MPPFLRPSVLCRVTHSPALTVLVSTLCLPGCFEGGFRFEDDSGCAPGAAGDCDATSPGLTDANTTATTGTAGTAETSGLFDTTAGGDSTGASDTAGGPTTESTGVDSSGPTDARDTGDAADGTNTPPLTPTVAWTMPITAGPVDTITVSHDGSLVAVSVLRQTVVRVFDGRTARLLHTFEPYVDTYDPDPLSDRSSVPGSLTFIGDTKSLFIVDSKGTASIWDATTATRTASYYLAWPQRVALSPDGRFVAFVREYGLEVELRNTVDGSLIRTVPTGMYLESFAAFAPDGKSVVSISKSGVFVAVDLETGNTTSFDDGSRYGEPLSAIYADNGRVIVFHGWQAVWAVDARTGAEIWSQPTRGYNCLSGRFGSATAGGDRVVFGYSPSGDCVLEFRDPRSGELLATTTFDDSSIAVALQPATGDWLVGVRSSLNTILRRFDRDATVLGDFALVTQGHDSWETSPLISPDGSRILTSDGSSTGAAMWNLATRTLERVFQTETTGAPISANRSVWARDSRRLVYSASDGVRILDVFTGAVTGPFAAPVGSSWFDFMDLSPDAHSLLMANGERKAYIRRFDDGFASSVTYREHRGLVTALSFSPDGTRAMTCSADETIAIWDVKTGETSQTFDTDGTVEHCLWRSNTAVVSTSSNGQAATWDINTGASITRYALRPNKNIRSLSSVISQDGRFVGAISRGRNYYSDSVLYLGTDAGPILTYRLPVSISEDAIVSVAKGQFLLVGRSIQLFTY